MKTQILEIDTLASQCGFFTSGYEVNNGYGCTHLDNEESEIVMMDGSRFWKERQVERFIIAKLTNRKVSCNRRLAKKFLKKAWKIMESTSELNRYGLDVHRKCFTFSCPLGHECDDKDFVNHGKDPGMYTVDDWVCTTDPIHEY